MWNNLSESLTNQLKISEFADSLKKNLKNAQKVIETSYEEAVRQNRFERNSWRFGDFSKKTVCEKRIFFNVN